MSPLPDKVFFRIGEASELVGVETHVLRYWETEFKMRTHRSDTGQRLYRRSDLEKFNRIKRLLHDEGFTIAGARRAIEDEGVEAVPAGQPRIDEARARLVGARERIAKLRQRLAMLAGTPTPR